MAAEQVRKSRPWHATWVGDDARGLGFYALVVLVFLLGVFARTWEYRSLPAGLRADETLAAVDAFTLYNFGADHNGDSYPLVMVGGGAGVSALFEYVLIPSIAVGGMNALAVRIPMLIAGILSLPLLFYVGRRIGGRRLGLIAMFLLAISPWHILASRRGHEAHLLPFIFLVAFALLLRSTSDDRWFIGASALYALCLYAYAPAYAAVPVFFGLAVLILFITRRARPAILVAGSVVFSLLAGPIVLFLLINALRFHTIHLGPFTVPRLPAEPRFESQTALFSRQPLVALKENALGLGTLLWKQGDGLPWNSVDPYGYFYRYTLPFAVVGAGLLVPLRKSKASAERLLVLAWLAASISLGLLQPVNINRINLIFVPLLLCLAMLLDWMWQHARVLLAASVGALLVAFILFTREYHGQRYRVESDYFFYSGFLQALDFARHADDAPICVTHEGVDEPFVFALFLEQENPADYQPDLEYVDPKADFRRPSQFGRYYFGVKPCRANSDDAVYVLHQSQSFPDAPSYTAHTFGNFVVYTPEE